MSNLEIIRKYQVDINNENLNKTTVNIFKYDTGRYIQVDVFDRNMEYNVEDYSIKADCTINGKLLFEIVDGIVVNHNSIKIPLKDMNIVDKNCAILSIRLIGDSSIVTILQLKVKIKSQDSISDAGSKPETIQRIIQEINYARDNFPELGFRLDYIEDIISSSSSKKIYFKKNCDIWSTPRIYFYRNKIDNKDYNGRIESWNINDSPYMIDEGNGIYSYSLIEGFTHVKFFCDKKDIRDFYYQTGSKNGIYFTHLCNTIPPISLYKTPIFIQNSKGFDGIWADYDRKTLKLFIQDALFDDILLPYGDIIDCYISNGDTKYESTFLGWLPVNMGENNQFSYGFDNILTRCRKFWEVELPIDIENNNLVLTVTRANNVTYTCTLSDDSDYVYDFLCYGVTAILSAAEYVLNNSYLDGYKYDLLSDNGTLRYFINNRDSVYLSKDIEEIRKAVEKINEIVNVSGYDIIRTHYNNAYSLDDIKSVFNEYNTIYYLHHNSQEICETFNCSLTDTLEVKVTKYGNQIVKVLETGSEYCKYRDSSDFVQISPNYMVDYELDNSRSTILSSDFKLFNNVVIKVPSEIDGNTITKVSNTAYAGNSIINKVIIPDNIRTFEGGTENDNLGAFRNCKNLVEVRTSDNYYGDGNIGNYAFAGCKNLKIVDLLTGKGNYINKGDHAFDGCDLSGMSLFLLDQSHSGKYCYANTKVTSVHLGGSSAQAVFSDVEGLFYNCQELVDCNSAYLDRSRWWAGAYMFYNCKKLSPPNWLPYLQAAHDYSFYGCISLVTDINVVDHIGEYAFAYSGITSARYGSYYGSAYFAKGAFLNCKSLESIEISNWANVWGLTGIFRDGSIGGCTALRTIRFPNIRDNDIGEVGHIGITAGEVDGVQYEGCTSLTDIYYGGSEDDEGWQLFVVANPIPAGVTVHFESDLDQG